MMKNCSIMKSICLVTVMILLGWSAVHHHNKSQHDASTTSNLFPHLAVDNHHHDAADPHGQQHHHHQQQQQQQQQQRRRLEEQPSSIKIPVFLVADKGASLSNRKFLQDLQASVSVASSSLWELSLHVAYTAEDQRGVVETSCQDKPAALARFDEFLLQKQDHLATELYKYCALKTEGGLWLDSMDSRWMIQLTDFLESLQLSFEGTNNGGSFPSLAVLGDEVEASQTVHGSMLYLSKDHVSIANEMVQVLTKPSVSEIVHNARFLSSSLYDLVESRTKNGPLRIGVNGRLEEDETQDEEGEESPAWYLLEQQCDLSFHASRGRGTCPLVHGGFCCRVLYQSETLFLARHAISPLPHETGLAKPYNSETLHYQEKDLPYIATIREEVFAKPEGLETKNMFDILMENQCLPDSVPCAKCLRWKAGANCKTCEEQCACYCKTLCHVKPDAKHVAKTITVSPPKYARDPNRLIPRIVHQTYFEELTQDKYPNMSRMVESFKQSGWEYRFYSDEGAQNFLSTHFPPEIRETYDTLRPGAFKADLFRYCALLIFGGVYADVDIVLESSLDASIPLDAGFVVPMDEPGSEANVRMCVWNGLIAATPAHPFLARVIETVVNQVRNRFTSVDVDATFCPDPELSVLHAFDTLFTAGPCALGAAMNRELGRPGQKMFTAGELLPEKEGIVIPGRTIILNQNKWDMGGHRFTLLEQNLVVAATDLPDSDDRESNANKVQKKTEHYSKTHASVGIYGLELLYNNDKTHQKADEDVRFVIANHAIQEPLAVAAS